MKFECCDCGKLFQSKDIVRISSNLLCKKCYVEHKEIEHKMDMEGFDENKPNTTTNCHNCHSLDDPGDQCKYCHKPLNDDDEFACALYIDGYFHHHDKWMCLNGIQFWTITAVILPILVMFLLLGCFL